MGSGGGCVSMGREWTASSTRSMGCVRHGLLKISSSGDIPPTPSNP